MHESDAWLVTNGEDLDIVKGSPENHSHAPNVEEVDAAKIVNSLKRKASEHSEARAPRTIIAYGIT